MIDKKGMLRRRTRASSSGQEPDGRKANNQRKRNVEEMNVSEATNEELKWRKRPLPPPAGGVPPLAEVVGMENDPFDFNPNDQNVGETKASEAADRESVGRKWPLPCRREAFL